MKSLRSWLVLGACLWALWHFALPVGQQLAPRSQRLFFIWVQGDLDHKVPLGGDDPTFQAWAKEVEALMQIFQRTSHPMRVELLADQGTFLQHQALWERWAKTYPDVWKLTDIRTIHWPDASWVLEQCEHGIPAVCSDILRIFYLRHDAYSINLYMDVDAFVYHRSHQTMSTAHLLGWDVKEPGLYHGASVGRDPKDSVVNNDYILSDRFEHWDFLHALAASRLVEYRDLLQHAALRSKIQSPRAYHSHMKTFLASWKKSPARNIHPLGWVVEAYGPWFWLHLSAEGRSRFYPLPASPTAGSWKGGSAISSQGSLSYQAAVAWLGEDLALESMRLLWMMEDVRHVRSSKLQNALQEEMWQLWCRQDAAVRAQWRWAFHMPLPGFNEQERAC